MKPWWIRNNPKPGPNRIQIDWIIIGSLIGAIFALWAANSIIQ